MKQSRQQKKIIRLTLLLTLISLFAACRESTFDDNFDPRLIKEVFASWGFTTSTDYTFDASAIEVSGNKATLKQVDTIHAGSDFSSGTHLGTAFANGVLKLTANADNAGTGAIYSGIYTSPKIDLGTTGNWTILSNSTSLPFFKELPGASGSESSTGYASVTANLSSGLVGLWHLNESAVTAGAGPNDFADTSGLGNHGEGSGSITFGAAGKLGKAPQFDGTDDYISLDSAIGSIQGHSNGTISLWFKSSSVAGQTLFAYANNAASNNLLQLQLGSVSGVFPDESIVFNVITGGTNRLRIWVRNGHTFYQDNNWHHAVVRVDGVENVIFIDGQKQTVTIDVGTTTTNHFSNLTVGNALSLGVRHFNNTFSGYFSGEMDELAVWSRGLSDAEILQLYRRGANRLKFQVRTCDDSACDTEIWKGPDNSASTYFSELHNYSAIDAAGNGSGSVQISPLTVSFADFNTAGLSVLDNRYFQYRVIMESDDGNNLCTGSPCVPELTSLTVSPTNRYYGGSPSILNNSGVSFSSIKNISFSNGGSCLPKYQISKDGSTFYYWNGSAWVLATAGVAHSSFPGDISSRIASFAGSIGSGRFFFKAFLPSDTSQACELHSIGIEFIK